MFVFHKTKKTQPKNKMLLLWQFALLIFFVVAIIVTFVLGLTLKRQTRTALIVFGSFLFVGFTVFLIVIFNNAVYPSTFTDSASMHPAAVLQ